MELLRDLFSLLGRVLISGVFLWGAYEKMTHWNQSLSYIKSKGIQYGHIILPAMIGLKIIGALSVLAGWHAHIGALLLAVVTVFALLKFHPFWEKQGNERGMEQMIFMKEVAILGGILMILALGAGHFGIGSGG